MGLAWKSVKLSHEISSLPSGSVWAGNTMRITFLLAFQQFCFRAWAKQGSAEAWELRGDTNTREHSLNCSKSLRATHCLRQDNSPASFTPLHGLTPSGGDSYFPVGQILLSWRQQSNHSNSHSNSNGVRQEHLDKDLDAF